jgi:WD40 repeat protein/uncharacterized caspase-like protein
MKQSFLLPLIFLAAISTSAQTIFLQPAAENTSRTAAFHAVRTSSAGDRFAMIAADRSVILTDAAFTDKGNISAGAAKAVSIAFSKDGRTLVAGMQDGNIVVCDAARAAALRSFAHGSSVRTVDIDPNGRVISGGYDRTVRLWDAVSGQFIGKFPAVSAEIVSLAFSPDGRIIIAGAADGSITLFNSTTYAVYRTATDFRSAPHTIVVSPDGKHFAAAHGDSTVSVWNSRSGELIGSLRSTTGAVTSIAFHPLHPYIISASSVLSFWDIPSMKMFHTAQGNGQPQFVTVSAAGILSVAGKTGALRSYQMLEKRPDKNPPIISLTSPVFTGNEPLKLFSSEVEITGLITDESPVPVFTVNGERAVLTAATAEERGTAGSDVNVFSFSATVPLTAAGTNTVTLSSTDAEGNTATRELPFIKLTKDAAVELVNPTESIETDQISIELQFKVWFDFASYSVQLNTIEVAKKENFPKRANGWLRTEKLSLSAGLNQITLTVSGRNGERIRKSLNISRRTLGAPVTTAEDKPLRNTSGQPQRWAVVVGVSEYGNPAIKNLAYADRDAKAFAEFLKSPAGGGFEEERVKLITNKEATLTNVKQALFNFLRQTVDKDLVVIYFAGHGAPEPANASNNYLLCYDTDPNSLETTAFPMWDVNTALQRYIPSKRVVVFTDACHSGGISSDIATRGMSSTDNNLINQYLTDLSKTKEGIIVFTASQAGEVSQELEKFGHGVFTYYLLQGMKGEADFNNDYTVTIGELMDFVEEKVKRQTNGNQHPTRNQGTYDKDLTISLIPN